MIIIMAFRFVDRIREEYEFWLVQVFGLTGIQICMNMYQIITSDVSSKLSFLDFTVVRNCNK